MPKKDKPPQLNTVWNAELDRATAPARAVRNEKIAEAVADFEKKRKIIWQPYEAIITAAREEFKATKAIEFARCRAGFLAGQSPANADAEASVASAPPATQAPPIPAAASAATHSGPATWNPKSAGTAVSASVREPGPAVREPGSATRAPARPDWRSSNLLSKKKER